MHAGSEILEFCQVIMTDLRLIECFVLLQWFRGSFGRSTVESALCPLVALDRWIRDSLHPAGAGEASARCSCFKMSTAQCFDHLPTAT